MSGGLTGALFGARVFRLISREALARLVALMLLATGVSLVARALA